MFNEQELIKMEYLLEPQKPGELECKKFLRHNGYRVQDVSNNPAYWSKDIDLIVDGKTTIEVKWDNRMATTGNLFIETLADIDNNKPGWFRFCEADYLFYGDAEEKIFCIFDFKKLKAHIEAHKEEYQERKAADKNKYSLGWLVPIGSLDGMYQCIDVGNF